MAKKEHKPAKSSKQVYAERKGAGICVSFAKFKAAKDSVYVRSLSQTPRCPPPGPGVLNKNRRHVAGTRLTKTF